MIENLPKFVGAKIRHYRKLNNMTQEELGKKLNTSKSRISNYETGYRSPQQDDLFILANALNISINDLFPAIDNSNDKETYPSQISKIAEQLIPARQKHVLSFAKHQLDLQEQNENKIISLNTYRNEQYSDVNVQGYTSAGTGETLLDDVSFSVQVKGYVPSHDIALQVNGDSMEPLFEDKEIIYIEKTNEINNGQIGVFIIEGEAYVKKVFVEEDRIRLVSLNKQYEDMYFYDNQGIEVVGKVIL